MLTILLAFLIGVITGIAVLGIINYFDEDE